MGVASPSAHMIVSVTPWCLQAYTFPPAGVDWTTVKRTRPSATSTYLPSSFFKMAATSSIQPPSVHALMQDNALLRNSDSPAESRQDESTASEGLTLRSLHHLPPEEINRRLEKTHRELSNRRKILIKNLPQDTTSQVSHSATTRLV